MTLFKFSFVSRACPFQFLIGKIMTQAMAIDEKGDVVFQFLIGKIMTPPGMRPILFMQSFNSS